MTAENKPLGEPDRSQPSRYRRSNEREEKGACREKKSFLRGRQHLRRNSTVKSKKGKTGSFLTLKSVKREKGEHGTWQSPHQVIRGVGKMIVGKVRDAFVSDGGGAAAHPFLGGKR